MKQKSSPIFFSGISLKEKMFFTKNLSVMVKSGLSLSSALDILARQTVNKKFKFILEEIKNSVEKGNTLTKSLSLYPKIFSELFINMVETGEKSGRLEESLEELSVQMKKSHELTAKVKGALTYPLFILAVMILMGIFMFITVIPKMMKVFEEIDAKLPLATRVVIKISDFFSHYGVFVLIGLAVLVILLIKIYQTAKGKKIFQGIVLNLPIFSGIVKKINLAKFCRTFTSLLATDIPIVQTLKITANVLGNVYYQEEIIKSCEEVKKGNSVVTLLEKKPKLFTPLLTQMIRVGEQTGTLDNILINLTNFYEQEVKDTLDNLTALIEPILIIFLGVAIGFIAVAIVMPMYSLTQSF